MDIKNREYKNILIIKMSSLGDVLHTLPAVAALRKGFPKARLTWLVHPQFGDFVPDPPIIDEVLYFFEYRWNQIDDEQHPDDQICHHDADLGKELNTGHIPSNRNGRENDEQEYADDIFDDECAHNEIRKRFLLEVMLFVGLENDHC